MSKDTNDVRIRFYTTETLGPKRHLTPEGFLVCEDVPIARTGEMIYGPDETPVAVGRDGRAVITRSEKEVFKPDSMASIVGKLVVNDHPPVDVDPKNWKYYACGVVMNSRRGDGELKNYLVSDIIIYDPDMIEDIDNDKREVSCGYNPEYLEVLDSAGNPIPGRGEQTDIIYNHLALVDRGRCGGRCSIGDKFTIDSAGSTQGRKDQRDPIGDRNTNKENTMAKKPSLVTRLLRTAFAAKDQAAFDAALEEIGDAVGEEEDEPVVIHNHIPDHRDDEPEIEVHNHVPDEGREDMPEMRDRRDAEGEEAPPWFKKHADEFKKVSDAVSGLQKWMEEEKKEGHSADEESETEDETEEEKMKKTEKVEDEKILGELEFEAPPGTNDKARKAKDSEYLADSFQDVVAKAEILAPGIRLPTFDKKMDPKKTFKTIDGLRRTALDLANSKPETRGLIDAALSNRSLDTKKMTSDLVRTLFNAVASVAAQDNNRRSTDGKVLPIGGEVIRGSINTIGDLNKRNRERFRGKKTA
jgi:hypothetical protein